MLCHLISAFLLSSSPNTHGFLQWQALWSSRRKNTRYDLCTANQLSDFSSRMTNTRYSYRMANHLSVLTSVGIGSLYPFTHCHCAQHSWVRSSSQSSLPRSYSKYHRQGLDFSDLKNTVNNSSLYHEDSDLLEWRLRDMHSSLFSCRTEVVVRHMLISENGDECHIITTFIMFLCADEYLRTRISLNWIEK